MLPVPAQAVGSVQQSGPVDVDEILELGARELLSAHRRCSGHRRLTPARLPAGPPIKTTMNPDKVAYGAHFLKTAQPDGG
jgi:hypothetical protein